MAAAVAVKTGVLQQLTIFAKVVTLFIKVIICEPFPWMFTDKSKAETLIQENALELAAALDGPFVSSDGRTFPMNKMTHPQCVRFELPNNDKDKD